MSFAIDLALSFLGLMLYSGVGMVTARVTHVLLCDSKESITDHPAPFFSGIFWPLGLPMLIPFYLYALKDKVKLPFVRRSPEQKVLSYAETPLLVLAQIVAQRIIAYPQGIDYRTWTSEDKKIKVDFRLSSNESEIERLYVNKKNFHRYDLKKDVIKTLNGAIREANKLKAAKTKSDAEAECQLAALEAVESLLLQPEKSND
jgi:hypothetical protein